MTVQIPLGFEVGTGQRIEIPSRHMAVMGQTQLSGKTTTLEALITRSNLRAIAFITKRGEGSFQASRQVLPFFQERADWEFIESVLESIMKQRMKFERAWIVRATKGASSLAGVQANVQKLMQTAKRSMDQDIYMLLGEYLSKVAPLVARLPKADRVQLGPGLNVMDLVAYPEELQMLVISSTLRWIHAHEQGVVTVIPEAWKFVPQGRKTPVKIEVEKLAREGAGIKNFIWIDSQDMAGVEKIILRSATVWLIGVQREANEVKRALANIPEGIKHPKPGDIARLGVGEFYACWGSHIHRVYVRPAWLDEESAREVALGRRAAEELKPKPPTRKVHTAPKPIEEKRTMATDTQPELLERYLRLKTELAELERQLGFNGTRPVSPVAPAAAAEAPADLDAIYDHVRRRLMNDPVLLQVAVTKPELQVEVARQTVRLDGKTLRGKLAEMIARGFFDKPATANAAFNELQRVGFRTAKPNVYRECDVLTGMGFLTKEADGYLVVSDMKVNIVE